MCIQIIAGIVPCENMIIWGKGRTAERTGGERRKKKCTFKGGGGDYKHTFYLLINLNFKMRYF